MFTCASPVVAPPKSPRRPQSHGGWVVGGEMEDGHDGVWRGRFQVEQ